MRFLSASALALVSLACAPAQTYLQYWKSNALYHAGSSNTYVNGCAVTNNGEFIVAGSDSSGAFAAVHYRNGVVKKIVHLGDDSTVIPATVRKVLVCKDGSTYIVANGYGSPYSSYDIVVSKLDTSYNKVWEHYYRHEEANQWEDAVDAAVDDDGNLYVCGGSQAVFGDYDPFFIRIAANGAKTYSKRMTQTGTYTECQGIAVRPDGGCWTTFSNLGQVYVWGAKADGTSEVYATTSASTISSSSIVVDATGTVFVGGYMIGVSSSDATIWKVNMGMGTFTPFQFGNSAGNVTLMTIWNGNLYAVDTASSGSILNLLIPTSTFPSVSWQYDFHYTSGSFNRAVQMQLDKAGELYVLGETTPNSSYTYYRPAVYKIGANGVFRWFNVYDPTSNPQDFPGGIAVHDSSGDVFVAGQRTGPSPTVANTAYRQAAIAVPDTFRAKKNTVYHSPTITYNDRYWLGCSITLEVPPSHGTVVLNANRTVTYTPDTGYVGTDLFRYKLSKVGVNSTLGSVTMIVEP